MAQIVCKNLAVGYGNTVVKSNINFYVEKGDYLCIIGENGCGKSTIMLAMSLMVKTSSAHMLSGDAISPDSFVEIEADGKKDKQMEKRRKENGTVYGVCLCDSYDIRTSAEWMRRTGQQGYS